jgi:hypothetical protein
MWFYFPIRKQAPKVIQFIAGVFRGYPIVPYIIDP